MAESVDHVVALFGGAERTFRYPRVEPHPKWKTAGVAEFSPFAAFQRLASGTWTLDDITRTLSPYRGGPAPYYPEGAIVAVLVANGPGKYAPLAGRVLEAALFGVSPRRARFDERNPFAADEEV